MEEFTTSGQQVAKEIGASVIRSAATATKVAQAVLSGSGMLEIVEDDLG